MRRRLATVGERPLRQGAKKRTRAPGVLDVETLLSGLPALLFLLDEENRFLDYRAGEELYLPPESFLGRRVGTKSCRRQLGPGWWRASPRPALAAGRCCWTTRCLFRTASATSRPG